MVWSFSEDEQVRRLADSKIDHTSSGEKDTSAMSSRGWGDAAQQLKEN